MYTIDARSQDMLPDTRQYYLSSYVDTSPFQEMVRSQAHAVPPQDEISGGTFHHTYRKSRRLREP